MQLNGWQELRKIVAVTARNTRRTTLALPGGAYMDDL